ncbi:MAG: hypothetical protein E7437_02240 [Ruminococcaceae bacterium]|nr:hypothetical protein [Oscillospiraceae bacterium]
MKTLKRSVSLLLALVMCLGLLSGVAMTATAAEDYSGTYYIAAKRSSGNYMYMTNTLTSGSTQRYQEEDSGLTKLPESIAADAVAENKTFTLTKNADGSYYVTDFDGKYLTHSSGNSGAFGTDANSAKKITVEPIGSEGAVQFKITSDKARILALNSTASNKYFAWYGSGQSNNLFLIPVEADDSGDIEECAHANTTTETVDATCTNDGSTTVTCADCQETVSRETIPALGHDYVNKVCTRCGDAPVDYSGIYYIATIRDSGNYQYMTNVLDTKPRYLCEDSGLTVLPEVVSSAVADPAKKFTLQMNDDCTYYVTDDNGKYLAWTSDNSGTLVDEAQADKLLLTVNDDGTVTLAIEDTPSRVLSLNKAASSGYFAWYAGTQLHNLALVPVEEGACTHTNTKLENVKAATCTEDGYTGDTVCADCGAIVESGTVEKALGHDHEATVTAPTPGQAGFTTYVCPACGDTYTEQLSLYTVSFAVPEGVAPIDNAYYVYGEGIVLPELTAAEGYTFLGWAESLIEMTDEAPAYMVPGTAYQPTANITLYPVYTYEDIGPDIISWTKIEFANITSADEIMITMTASDGTVYAMPTDSDKRNSKGAPLAIEVTVANDTATPAEGDTSNYGFTITPVTNGDVTEYAITVGGKYLHSIKDNNGMRIGNTERYWTVLNDHLKSTDGTSDRYLGVYNKTDWRAYTSINNNISGQVVGFYKKTAAPGVQSVLYSSLEATAPTAVCQISSYDGLRAYLSLDKALEACAEGEYVKLLQDIAQDVTVAKNVYIDLAGHSITGSVTIAEGVTLYGMDTKTNDYECASGYGTLKLSAESKGSVAESVRSVSTSGNVYRYLTVVEDGAYSFHRFYVGVTKLTLRTGNKGFGYKLRFVGDEKVQANLDGFGIRMYLEGSDNVVTRNVTMKDYDGNKEFSLLIGNFDIVNYGDVNVNVEGFLTLKAGEELKSTTVSYSMKSMLGMINEKLGDYSDAQILAIQQMLTDEEKTVVSNWGFTELLNWTAPEN